MESSGAGEREHGERRRLMVKREVVLEAVNGLPDERIEEVLGFISYLQWREGLLEDQSWFWSPEWHLNFAQN